MDHEIQRVARELYKALNGMNEAFENVKDQIVVDDLTTHTDNGRQEMIHPYKTLYGRDLNQVLRDNLGDNWDEACNILMTEMRMYELECLRRRMEDEAEAAVELRRMEDEAEAEAALELAKAESNLSSRNSSVSGLKSNSSKNGDKKKKKNGSAHSAGSRSRSMKLEEMVDEAAKTNREDEFTGHSCLLITWKTNAEVEQFKELYMDTNIKTHKRKKTTPVDPGDLVSEKNLAKCYKIIGKGEGVERLLIKKEKKGETEEVEGDTFKYFLLAGTSHPYPDDTFYSVGRVPRKLLLKYLGIKMYLVRLRAPPVLPVASPLSPQNQRRLRQS